MHRKYVVRECMIAAIIISLIAAAVVLELHDKWTVGLWFLIVFMVLCIDVQNDRKRAEPQALIEGEYHDR